MDNVLEKGYFWMQVNSERKGRVLFSVWSPFEPRDPQKVSLMSINNLRG